MDRPGPPVSAAGIAWYKRADYSRILEIMDDREVFSPTFDKWQSKAEDTERQMKARGFVVVRAHIDPEHFAAWCAANDLNVDAKARTRWGNEAARRHFASGH